MKLSQLAAITHGQLIGQDMFFETVNIDTRSLKSNELFIAIKGTNFDGHDFLPIAQQKQAVAAVVEHPTASQLPQLVVSDTIEALGQLAAWHRQQFHIPVIAVTGSCGKTTTKMLIANILQQDHTVLFSEGSFNNAIGLPLTILKLKPEHQCMILEMGTNHFGEIAYLTQIGRPTVAAITNAGEAHLEAFKDTAGVSRAKGEIFQGLASDGVAIINIDDTFAPYWENLAAPRPIIRFGLVNSADFTAKNIVLNEEGKTSFILVTPQGEVSVQLPLLGRHNIYNALTAAACALAIGASLEAIQQGLTTAKAVKKRLNVYSTEAGAKIIDDSYNATPTSVKAALETLANQPGETMLVLGDMKELGPDAAKYHHTIGKMAQQLGISKLFTYGELSVITAKSFGDQATSFTDQAILIQALKKILHPQMTVLIKGSRAMRMEHIVEAIVVKE